MKIKEIRDLSLDELQLKEKSMSEELFKLRFRKAVGQLESTASLKSLKHDIARVKTVLREKEVRV